MLRHRNPVGFRLEEVLAQNLSPKLNDLHVNYRYMLSWSKAVAERKPGARILDFGCGPGMVVEAGRSLGFDIYGADSFYEGEQDFPLVKKSGLLETAIRKIQDGRVPFEDASFDLIVSNQVLEHVENLEQTLSELTRLIKRDGLLLFLFPTKEVIREAHCGVPFLHWINRSALFRVPYAARWKWAGNSFDKEKKTPEAWAREAVEWMDRYVYYRTWPDLRAQLGAKFDYQTVESHYLAYRLIQKGRLKHLAPLLRIPSFGEAGRWICRRLNGAVVLAKKRDAGSLPLDNRPSDNVAQALRTLGS